MLLEMIEDSSRVGEYEALAVLFQEGDLSPLQSLNDQLRDSGTKGASAWNFRGQKGEIVKLTHYKENLRAIYLVGLGKKDEKELKKGKALDLLRSCAAKAVKEAMKDRLGSLAIVSPSSPDERETTAIAEGAILGGYRFDKYKKPDEENPQKNIEKIAIFGANAKGLADGIMRGEAQCFARDLVNEPGNVINPITLADTARMMASSEGLECVIFDETQIAEMGMNALLAVGVGSATPPRLIHITYRPAGESKGRIVIIGKGLTFDSGGLDLKSAEFMRTMKSDKAGACNVLAIMRTVARLKPSIEIHGLIGAVENKPDGKAYRPDDIVIAKNGKSIEIDNTDAEGRLTLADVLCYACELKPDKIVDMATLTGACVVGLGDYTAGLFSNDDGLTQALEMGASNTGERLWRLPMDDEALRKKIKSDVADLLNSGGRYGGAITAAMFLEEFVEKAIPWAHLDIAGPAFLKEEQSYTPKGGTGFGVRTILEFLKNQ